MENRPLKIDFYLLAIFNAAFLAHNYYFDIVHVAAPIFYILRRIVLVILLITLAIQAGRIFLRYQSESKSIKLKTEEKIREARADAINRIWVLK